MKREEKKQRLYQHILDQTLKLLEHKSWSAITAEDIVKQAEVSKRTLYAYFPSIHLIYLALIKKSFEERNAYLDAHIDLDQEIKPLLYNLAKHIMTFSMSSSIEANLINQYDENLYIEQYPVHVKEISDIANKYELSQLFTLKELDTDIYNKYLAIFLWSSITGWIDIIKSKKNWLTTYFQSDIDKLYEEHLNILNKFLETL
jgi:AcrR family transcriptional regulator